MRISPRYAWRTAFTPADRRSIEEWAGENIELPPVLTIQGKFRTDHSRHFIGPLQAIRHERIRQINILKPVRGGGTLIADAAVPWGIVNDNASVLWIFQDDKIAPKHAEERQWPILMNVPAIRPMLHVDHHKTRKANILFANGLPLTLQGPALGGLQSRGFKWVVLDECWMYEPGTVSQAKARMGDFVKNASNKCIMISQGGPDDGEWDQECRSATQYVWKPKCEGCGKPMEIEWSHPMSDRTFRGMVFDTIKNTDGTYNKEASGETARFVCKICGHAHPDTLKTKARWNETGWYYNANTGEAWDKDAPKPPKSVLFRWHAIIDYPWAELVVEWLAAQEAKHVGNFEPLINFFLKRCTLFRSERTIHDRDFSFATFDSQPLDPKEKAWPEEVKRFCTADRQREDVYWVMVRAWAKTGESRRLYYGRVYGEAGVEAIRERFSVPPNCTVCDSGYMAKSDHGVYSACIRYGWKAFKGTDDHAFWHIIPADPKTKRPAMRVQRPWAPIAYGDPGEGTAAKGKKKCPLFRFSSPTAYKRVMGLISRGLWVEPEVEPDEEMGKELKIQMAAEYEKPVMNPKTYKMTTMLVCPSGNNHGLDCAKEQVICAMHAGLLPNGVELTEKSKEGAPANN